MAQPEVPPLQKRGRGCASPLLHSGDLLRWGHLTRQRLCQTGNHQRRGRGRATTWEGPKRPPPKPGWSFLAPKSSRNSGRFHLLCCPRSSSISLGLRGAPSCLSPPRSAHQKMRPGVSPASRTGGAGTAWTHTDRYTTEQEQPLQCQRDGRAAPTCQPSLQPPPPTPTPGVAQ